MIWQKVSFQIFTGIIYDNNYLKKNNNHSITIVNVKPMSKCYNCDNKF